MEGDEKIGGVGHSENLRPVYVAVAERASDVIDVAALWRKLLDGKWLLIGVTFVFTAASVAYALLATPIYRAEVVLAPAAQDRLAGAAQSLGGLASIAGINLSKGRESADALATLQSRQFAEEFIRDKQLMPLLFAEEWDATHRRWLASDPQNQPDIRDGVRVFSREIRTVAEDGKTGLVTLGINWTDPEQAAEWAMEMVARLNERTRNRDLQESERKLVYLNKQLESAQLIELREAIARVIEDQISVMMLAQAQSEYAFRVIDPAVAPKQRSWPKRTLIVIAATVLGGLIGAFLVLVRAPRNPHR